MSQSLNFFFKPEIKQKSKTSTSFEKKRLLLAFWVNFSDVNKREVEM